MSLRKFGIAEIDRDLVVARIEREGAAQMPDRCAEIACRQQRCPEAGMGARHR
jgi:hypothetical protein